MVFICNRCLAENQLTAGDVCVPISPNGFEYLTPKCPTPGCGHVSKVHFAEYDRALLKIGLEPDDVEEQVANAS